MHAAVSQAASISFQDRPVFMQLQQQEEDALLAQVAGQKILYGKAGIMSETALSLEPDQCGSKQGSSLPGPSAAVLQAR